MFKITLRPDVDEKLISWSKQPSMKKIGKAVTKALEFMRTNIRHTSLNTHKFDDLCGPNGEEIFESYAQNNTPGAYRIFWYYGPEKKEITVVAITPHPLLNSLDIQL